MYGLGPRPKRDTLEAIRAGVPYRGSTENK